MSVKHLRRDMQQTVGHLELEFKKGVHNGYKFESHHQAELAEAIRENEGRTRKAPGKI